MLDKGDYKAIGLIVGVAMLVFLLAGVINSGANTDTEPKQVKIEEPYGFHEAGIIEEVVSTNGLHEALFKGDTIYVSTTHLDSAKGHANYVCEVLRQNTLPKHTSYATVRMIDAYTLVKDKEFKTIEKLTCKIDV